MDVRVIHRPFHHRKANHDGILALDSLEGLVPLAADPLTGFKSSGMSAALDGAHGDHQKQDAGIVEPDRHIGQRSILGRKILKFQNSHGECLRKWHHVKRNQRWPN